MSRDTAELLKGRRTVRRFRDETVGGSAVKAILEAGTWAPSAHNAQPWRFAVVVSQARKGELVRRMGEKWRADLERDGVSECQIESLLDEAKTTMMSAPVLIVVCVTMEDMDVYQDDVRNRAEWVMAVQSAAACIENMLLMTHALKLGACWNCGPLFAPDEAKGALGLNSNWQPTAMIAIGFPAESPEAPQRKTSDEVSIWI